MKTRLSLLTLLACLLLWPGLATGQGDSAKAQARKHFARGIELVDENAFAAAASEFRKAYELAPHHVVLFNLAQVYIAMSKPVLAVDTLERFLKEGGERISSEQKAKAEKALRRERNRIGQVIINVRPPGARVLLDCAELKADQRVQPLRLAAGTHELSAYLPGYQAASRSFSIQPKKQVSVVLRLSPLPSATTKARLSISCNVPDVAVLVDDNPVGKTPLRNGINVATGRRKVSFVRAGYQAVFLNMDLALDSPGQLECGVKPLAPLPSALSATIAFDVSEPHAELFIDQQMVSPISTVPVGLHQIEVRRTGFHTVQRTVRVEPGSRQVVQVQLEPTASFVADYQQRAKSHRQWAYIIGGTGLGLAVATFAVFGWNHGRFNDWQDEQTQLDGEFGHGPPYAADFRTRQNANNDRLNSIYDMDILTTAFGIGSAALLTTSIVLFATGDDPDRYEGLVVSPQVDGTTIGWKANW